MLPLMNAPITESVVAKIERAEVPCPHCKTMFIPWRWGSPLKYCSKACSGLAIRTIVPARPCSQCGKSFVPTKGGIPHESKKKPARYCGNRCASDAKMVAPAERNCDVCGKMFLVGPWKGCHDPRTKRCSAECRKVARPRWGAEASTLSEIDAAYLAGLVDGEGCVSLVPRKGGGAHVRLVIVNTNRQVLDWCQQVCGVGAVYDRGEQKSRKWRRSFYWGVLCGGADGVLRQIRKHLKIKTAQADLAIEMHARLGDREYRRDRSWQTEFMARMKLLNARGPRDEPPGE